MEWLSPIADVVGILGAFFALFAWIKARQVRQMLEKQRQRQNESVKVILSYGADKLELPVALRREELTRAEILGRLGMIPMKIKGQRFSLGDLNTAGFLEQITQILDGSRGATLIISCTEEEFNQFDLDSFRKSVVS